MNELGNIGFTYDIKTFTPDGEKKDDFSVHNLITDEGLRWVVARIFAQNTEKKISSYNIPYSNLNVFYLSFFTNQFSLNGKFDTLESISSQSGETELKDKLIYNYDFQTNPSTTNNNRIEYTVNTFNSFTNTLTFKESKNDYTIICKNSPLLLTGLFMSIKTSSWYSTPTFGSWSDPPSILLSEAMFPEPILLEVGGKLQVNCGCTVISA